MNKAITSVVIVGGGNAGWISAGTIAAKLKAEMAIPPSITLIESPDIPTVGVGEGTWPTMRRTLKNMGVRETDFIRQCNVTFKQGAKFSQWVTGENSDFYYHPLVLPEAYDHTNLASYWLNFPNNKRFSESVCPQDEICEKGLAPKLITTAEYDAVLNYAYHLDAGAFTHFLKQHCIDNLNIKYISDNVRNIQSDQNGDITAVKTEHHGDIGGDLFIDCTGFKSLLLGEHLKVPFIPCSKILFADTAIAVQVPYPNEDTPIASHTISTAQTAGWIWDIGLSSRRGVGHVFSSAHISAEQAYQQLCEYLRNDIENPESLDVKTIPIKAGHRKLFWKNNCVAVGLAAGFLEPLEASAIVLIEMSATAIAEQFPATRSAMHNIAKRFNRTFQYRWERIIDFLKLHYLLSKREDHDFWRDNRNANSIPESLQELIDIWRFHPPWHQDFDRAVEVFPSASYQYILYGMGYTTHTASSGISENIKKQSSLTIQSNTHKTEKLLKTLPKHRDILNKIAQYGMQRI